MFIISIVERSFLAQILVDLYILTRSHNISTCKILVHRFVLILCNVVPLSDVKHFRYVAGFFQVNMFSGYHFRISYIFIMYLVELPKITETSVTVWSGNNKTVIQYTPEHCTTTEKNLKKKNNINLCFHEFYL